MQVSTEVIYTKLYYPFLKFHNCCLKCDVSVAPSVALLLSFLCLVFKVHVPADLPVVENSGIEPLTS